MAAALALRRKLMDNETGNQLLEERPASVSEFNPSEFENLCRLADQIEELSRQPCYLEWTSTGVVSRYVDGLRARVDLERPDFVNRRAYLSVEQLEKLAAMPEVKIQLDYGANLTSRHFSTHSSLQRGLLSPETGRPGSASNDRHSGRIQKCGKTAVRSFRGQVESHRRRWHPRSGCYYRHGGKIR